MDGLVSSRVSFRDVPQNSVDMDTSNPPPIREESKNVFETIKKQNKIKVEQSKAFVGEQVSAFSFFWMFPTIVFVTKGSVITAIWIELLLTLAISIFMVWFREKQRKDGYDPSGCTSWCFPAEPIGHSIVGTLLAFLVVFRSQIAYNMYMEGRSHLQKCLTSCTEFATEVLGCLAFQVVELNADGGDSKVMAQLRSVRTPAAAARSQEHPHGEWVRKAVGEEAASRILEKMTEHEVDYDVQLLKFLSDAAWAELGASSAVHRAKLMRAASKLPPAKMTDEERECKNLELAFFAQEVVRLTKLFFFSVIEHIRSSEGHAAWEDAHEMVNVFTTEREEAEFYCQFGGVQQRRKVQVFAGAFDETGHPLKSSPQRELSALNLQSRGSPPSFTPRRAPGGIANVEDDEPDTVALDPTRSKPVMVLLWLQLTIERMRRQEAIQPQKLTSLSRRMDGMLDSFHGVEKVDSMVLPFPYCQLLKIFMLFFCFSLPVVLSGVLYGWTPIVCLFTSMGFFGLDQVGAELEQPFGLDRNDFPLLSFGKSLCNDLDQLMRSLEMTRYSARIRSSQEHYDNAARAASNLGWASESVCESAQPSSVTSVDPPLQAPTVVSNES